MRRRKRLVKKFNFDEGSAPKPVQSLVDSIDSTFDYEFDTAGLGRALYSVFAHLYSPHQYEIHPADFLSSDYFISHTHQVSDYFIAQIESKAPQLTSSQKRAFANHIVMTVLGAVLENIELINEPSEWVAIATKAGGDYYINHISNVIHSATGLYRMLRYAIHLDACGKYELADKYTNFVRKATSIDTDDPQYHLEQAMDYDHATAYEPAQFDDTTFELKSVGMQTPYKWAPYDANKERFIKRQRSREYAILSSDEPPEDLTAHIQAVYNDNTQNKIVQKFGTPDQVEERRKSLEKTRQFRDSPPGQWEYYSRQQNQLANKVKDFQARADKYESPKYKYAVAQKEIINTMLNQAKAEKHRVDAILKQLSQSYPELVDPSVSPQSMFESYKNQILHEYSDMNTISMKIRHFNSQKRDPKRAEFIDGINFEIQLLEKEMKQIEDRLLVSTAKFKDFALKNPTMPTESFFESLADQYPRFYTQLSAKHPDLFDF